MDDEEFLDFLKPYTDDGRRLLGVSTPFGLARPRWTKGFELYLDGDGFSEPVSRFDHKTLEPVFARGVTSGLPADRWASHLHPSPGSNAPLPFDEVETGLGRAKPSLGPDGTLSLEIGGRTRPMHHFASSALTPVSSPTAASSAAPSAAPLPGSAPGSAAGGATATPPLTAAQVAAALAGATSSASWAQFQSAHGLKYALPSDDIRNQYGRGDVTVTPRFARSFSDAQWNMGMHDGGGIDHAQYDEVVDSALPDYLDSLLALGDVGTVAGLDEVGENAALADAYRNSDPNTRGQPGSLYLKKPGLYDPGATHDPRNPRPRNVYLAVKRPYHKGPTAGVQGSVNMNFHERLHALDDILGNLHSTSDFVAAWVADNARFDDGTGYYRLKGDGGTQVELGHALSDTFAESGAMYYKDEKTRDALKKRAPGLYEYWRNLDETLKGGSLPSSSYDSSGYRRATS